MDLKTCCMNNCGSPVLAKNFCRKHYLRQYKYGDPSVVKKPSEYIKRGEDAPQYKHGLWQHPLYKIWNNMLNRCQNPADAAYSNYGARGIFVCKEWQSLKKFIADMGERPEGYTLDRIDNNKGYSPENCHWATMTAQSRNRRFTKLTLEKAREIRAKKETGIKKQALADEFCVSVATIKKVVSGVYWKESSS